jgi:hypothetical protein
MTLNERLSEIAQRAGALDQPMHSQTMRDLLALAREYRDELAEAVRLLHMHHDDEHPYDECCPTCAFLARQGEKHE